MARRPTRRRSESTKTCGLCGKTSNLSRTACCGNWICDDADQYVVFSYERNSCHRNHDRYTLCALHYHEGHDGDWTSCDRCPVDIETEMYVWYGTNEYNFEALKDPPAYEPTRCSDCGRVIRLGREAYSMQRGKYICDECTSFKIPGGSG